jgi:hypothetical protein
MIDFEVIHRLLTDCGFRNMLWPPPGQRWGVVGELDGGARIVITCVPVRGGWTLQVSSQATRDWVHDFLVLHDLGHVPIQVGTVHHPEGRLPSPWLAVAIGAAAMGLFLWVWSSVGGAAAAIAAR